MKSNTIFNILTFVFAVVGLFIGFYLSALETYETFKLLNIIGILFDLLGLLTVSYFLLASEKVRYFLANWLTACVGDAILFIPIGIFLISTVLIFFNFPSAGKTASLGISFFIYGIVPVILLEDFALIPKWSKFSNDIKRLKFLGGFLLIGGLLLQFIAAFMDFRS